MHKTLFAVSVVTLLVAGYETAPGKTGAASDDVTIETARVPNTMTVVSDGWKIQWDRSRGVAQHLEPPADRVVLYEQPKAHKDCEYNEVRGRVLSVVGSLVSVRTAYGWYCGGAHPGHLVSFAAIDLRTGTRADIRQLVPDAVITTALKQDDLVRAALGGFDPLDLDSLVERADGGCEVSYRSLPTSFAIYNVRDGKATVRFGLSHACEFARGALTEIEIEVPAPQGLKLERANFKGLLMKDLAPGPPRRG